MWPSLAAVSNDFPVYYLSARALRDGRPLEGLYERAFWREESARVGLPTAGTFVPFPPANALLLRPLAGATPATAKALWSGGLALALLASFLALRRLAPEAGAWLVALAVVSQTASLRNALLYGQPYPLLLLLLSASLAILVRGQAFVAGLLLAPVVALKLYALPFVLFLALRRRWPAVLGVAVGVAAITAVSLALLGPEVHRVYASGVLRESLDGRVLDPYSTTWGSAASVARRLFQLEPELNPHPVADLPALARALGRGVGALVAVLAVAIGVQHARAGRLRRAWATLALGSLAASPLPSSYHMVLLALPVALMVAEEDRPGWRWAVLGLAAFAGSPLPHHLAPLAVGWGNVVAPARLFALLGLLAVSARGVRVQGPLAWASAAAVVAAATALAAHPEDPGWTRVPEARGLLAADPAACGGGLSWLTVEDGRYRYRQADGTLADEPPCAPAHVSPDGAWTLSSEFTDGSWDLWARNVRTGEGLRLSRDPANEREPAFLPDGRTVVFASDRRRGLGATTLFTIPFEAPQRTGSSTSGVFDSSAAVSASRRPARPRP